MPRRTAFDYNGKPTTIPYTTDDAERIALSQALTAILVRHGDEKPGHYHTPGADGYAAWEVAEAKRRLKPDKPKVKKEKIKHRRLPPKRSKTC